MVLYISDQEPVFMLLILTDLLNGKPRPVTNLLVPEMLLEIMGRFILQDIVESFKLSTQMGQRVLEFLLARVQPLLSETMAQYII
jgi:hypothetical protein